MVDHTFMAIPVPLQILWTPWTIFVPLMFPRSSLKTCIIFYMRLLNLYSDMTLKPVYIGMCAKGQIFLDFSFMWIWVTCLLAFHMPWDHSDLTFHYPIKALYKEPFGYIEGKELKSKRTIVHCCRSLYLSLHPFVPWSTLCSSQACLCLWACYQEMEDWGGGGPGGRLSFSSSQTCRHRSSLM